MKAAANPIKSLIYVRLKQARIDAGYPTAKEFSERNNLKISTYALHEAGTRGLTLDVIEHYAQLLKLNINWLLTGTGPKSATHVRQVPIIEWSEVAAYPGQVNLKRKEWTHSDIDLSPQSFALTVLDDSMEPRYPEGTIIIVDCEQKPKNKDFALIAVKEKKIFSFKQIVQLDGTLYAKSLNPAYPSFPLAKNSQLIGKVVQAKLVF